MMSQFLYQTGKVLDQSNDKQAENEGYCLEKLEHTDRLATSFA